MTMTLTTSAKKCASTCWYVSVGLGLLLSIVLIGAAGWSFLWGALLGVVVFLALGFVLPQVICTGDRAERPLAATSTPSSLVAGDPPAPMPEAPRAPEETPAKPASQAHPIADEAARPVPQDAVVAAPEDLEKPATLDAPRAGGADDLKRIKGIGPKLEAALNDMGIYHFDQIANWTEAEIDWVDCNLTGFKGRASRDEWVRQAVTLARGDAS
ncbi:MAG TPA: NADH:ubiquinone oxidoreductase [Roseovarius sp.]